MNIRGILCILIAFCAFIIINAPSVKLVYSSEFINIIPTAFVWVLGLFRIAIFNNEIIKVGKFRKWFLLLLTFLWIILFISGLFGVESNVDFRNVTQYFGVYVTVLGLLLFLNHKDIVYIIRFQVIWALLLALIQMLVGVELSADKGQHYLTLGVPLASGLVCAISMVYVNQKVILKSIYLICSSVIIVGLTTLNGRGPIILSTITIVFFWILLTLNSYSFKQALKKVIGFLVIGSVVVFIFLNNISERWIDRFKRLMNPDDEPRSYIYGRTIDLIMQKPYGYGLNAHETLIGRYPHNIFLELFLSSGAISVGFFLAILVIFGVCLKKSIQSRSYLLPFAMLATYLFFTWNISFDLASSYIPFGAIAVTISSFEDEHFNRMVN